MNPPIFAILASSAAVKTILGAPPDMRFYPFGQAVQNALAPYATFQVISNIPENYLGDLPDADDYRVQVDVWAMTQASANDTAQAIRDAVEPHAYMVNGGNTSRDPETGKYRYLLEFQFQERR